MDAKSTINKRSAAFGYGKKSDITAGTELTQNSFIKQNLKSWTEE